MMISGDAGMALRRLIRSGARTQCTRTVVTRAYGAAERTSRSLQSQNFRSQKVFGSAVRGVLEGFVLSSSLTAVVRQKKTMIPAKGSLIPDQAWEAS